MSAWMGRIFSPLVGEGGSPIAPRRMRAVQRSETSASWNTPHPTSLAGPPQGEGKVLSRDRRRRRDSRRHEPRRRSGRCAARHGGGRRPEHIRACRMSAPRHRRHHRRRRGTGHHGRCGILPGRQGRHWRTSGGRRRAARRPAHIAWCRIAVPAVADVDLAPSSTTTVQAPRSTRQEQDGKTLAREDRRKKLHEYVSLETPVPALNAPVDPRHSLAKCNPRLRSRRMPESDGDVLAHTAFDVRWPPPLDHAWPGSGR